MPPPIDRAGLGKLLAETIRSRLIVCEGRILSPRSFAESSGIGLLPHETQYVRLHAELLSASPPVEINQAVRLAAPSEEGREIGLAFEPDGARSATLSCGLQLKGCRPVVGAAQFPTLRLEDSGRFSYDAVDFGVLSHEAVSRELLGYLFARKNGLKALREPAAVIEYTPTSFCLVFRTVAGERVETRLQYPSCTLGDLFTLAILEQEFGLDLSPGEVPLRDVSLAAYARCRGRELARWHLAGGFRGVLNSNIGNDLILSGDDTQLLFAMVDFDSFHLLATPPPGDENGLMRFLLHAAVEAIRSSPPLATAVLASAGGAAIDKFERRSLSWRHYFEALSQGLYARGWTSEAIATAWTQVRRAPAVESVCADNMVDIASLSSTYSPDDSVYRAHGPGFEAGRIN